MDFIKNAAKELTENKQEGSTNNNNEGGNSVQNNLIGTLNNALGGGAKGEKKEDVLDKAVDAFQEHVLKAGAQNNESAVEQAKDEQIANAIRTGFKSATGKDFPTL
ncbi:hypothetical protein NLJ89_g7530 [Agrocybe chaxingu]|uniref:Uncharacterized protein n=1 Tax=Agrocybe chaxingu TaxID=84603 RepID=A0A9W8JWM5_9AGAR|nr:hypothetical protein NLJ89_g7530 [Agrocybe chaxingu]